VSHAVKVQEGGEMSRLDRRIDKAVMGWAEDASDMMGHITDLQVKVLLHAEAIRFNGCCQETEFNCLKDLVRSLKEDIRLVKESYLDLVNAYEEAVECEVCGCLLKKGTAIRGESVIEVDDKCELKTCRDDDCIFDALDAFPPSGMETIREVFYCKVHQPKGKK